MRPKPLKLPSKEELRNVFDYNPTKNKYFDRISKLKQQLSELERGGDE